MVSASWALGRLHPTWSHWSGRSSWLHLIDSAIREIRKVHRAVEHGGVASAILVNGRPRVPLGVLEHGFTAVVFSEDVPPSCDTSNQISNLPQSPTKLAFVWSYLGDVHLPTQFVNEYVSKCAVLDANMSVCTVQIRCEELRIPDGPSSRELSGNPRNHTDGVGLRKVY